MSIGVFEVAASGDDEQRIQKQAAADKLNAAIYDVRERFGKFLFGAEDLQAFQDRSKLAFTDICQAIEPHLHARTGVHRRVMKAMEKEWREKQATLTEDSISNSIDTSLSNAAAGPKGPKTPRMPHQHVQGPQLEGRRRQADGPSVQEDPERAHAIFDRANELVDEKAQPALDPAFQQDPGFQPGADPGFEAQLGAPTGDSLGAMPPGPEDHFVASRHLACYPGCDKDEAHAKKFHKDKEDKEARVAAQPRDPSFETDHGEHFNFSPEHGHAHHGEPTDFDELMHGNPWDEDSYYRTHATRRQAEFDEASPNSHPELDTNVTFDDNSQGDTLEPKGDFESYKDSVDQGADSKVDHDFVSPDSRNTSTSEVTEHHENGDHNFVPTVTGSLEYQRIARMIQADAMGGAPSMAPPTAAGNAPAQPTSAAPAPAAGPPPTPDITTTPNAGAGAPVPGLSPQMTGARSEYHTINAMLHQSAVQAGHRWASKAVVQDGTRGARARLIAVCGDKGILTKKQAVRLAALVKRADSNYLQKADEALTKVLNEKAEEFQATIAPLQQALITIQQAEQLANPLNVSPPAGTVNVLPGQQQPPAAPGNMPQLGADPAAAGLAGQPAAPGQLQARKRGGRGKA